jgi:transmembrane sensor
MVDGSRTESKMQTDEQIMEQALRWQAATARDDCDWQKFTEWLEASPVHRQVFDDAALLEERIARHRHALADAAPPRAARLWRRSWVAAAVAAGMAMVAVIVAEPLRPFLAGERTFVAQAGTLRTLSLDGGVQVTLAPGSSLRVAGRKDQRLRLDGDAWFDVPHEPGRELSITAGPYEVRDIGTRFEVMSAATQLKVAVAEGEVQVLLPGSARPSPVNAGQQLLVAGDPPIAEYGNLAADDVAGWRSGRLVFHNEPLSIVAPQLGRHAGVSVTVDPAIAQRRFSGVLAIGDRTQMVAQLGEIMDLQVQRTGTAVHLSAAGEPAGR